MTWFDVLVTLFVIAFLIWEARQEAGRAVLDTLATVAAAQVSATLAAPLTMLLHWKQFAGTGVSPLAQTLCFVIVWAACLALAREVHRHTRLSADVLDPLIGVAAGLLIAAVAGHVLVDGGARMAIMAHGALPEYLDNSWVADELRTFRSYQFVLDHFHRYQNGGY